MMDIEVNIERQRVSKSRDKHRRTCCRHNDYVSDAKPKARFW